jgi:hypothetical protein
MKDKNGGGSPVKRGGNIGLYIGLGLFLAFPLKKNGMLSDISAGIGFVMIAIYVFFVIRRKMTKKLNRGQGDF